MSVWSSSMRGGVGRQVELRDLGCRAHDAPVARGLAVLEDRAPGERRDLAHRDGLGEQHGRVGVVAGREVDEPQRHEQLVAVVARLELGDELRPDDLDEHAPRRGGSCDAVLRVHREDDEVTRGRRSRCCCGWKAISESRKSGTPKPSSDPAAGSRRRARRGRRASCGKRGASSAIGVDDVADVARAAGLVGLLGNRAVLDLQRLQRDGGLLQAEPGRMRGQRRERHGRPRRPRVLRQLLPLRTGIRTVT